MEYFQKVVELRAYLNEIESYLMEIESYLMEMSLKKFRCNSREQQRNKPMFN